MFVYQQGFAYPCRPCTKETFTAIATNKDYADRISRARAALAAGQRQVYDSLKRSLPAFCFQAYFDPNCGKTNTRPKDTWRLQSAAHLTGLVMLDFDHLKEDPKEVFARIPRHFLDDGSRFQIFYAAITCSGQGLRLVCAAEHNAGNLADNQAAISQAFGLECDQSVKNADRMSFANTAADILFLNDAMFNFNNTDYDTQFGEQYRNGSSQPVKVFNRIPAASADAAAVTPQPAAAESTPKDGEPSAPQEKPEKSLTPSPSPKERGVDSLSQVVEKWLKNNGAPAVGSRHITALRLAADLRYVTDNDPKRIKEALLTAPFVRDMVSEGAEQEIDDICRDVVGRKMNLTMPRRMERAVASASGSGEGASSAEDDRLTEVYDKFWERLQPLMAAPYDVATYRMSDANKLGGVFAAAGMFCTLMTRCWYRHFDGNDQRMNPQVYLIGNPASGKGEAEKMDQMIMAPVIVADRVGREAEAEYKRKQKERSTSSKAQKGDALQRPEFCIRYLPSRTSNAVFFRRAKNAVEEHNGEKQPLHLYTFDSELDGNTTAQSSGAWIGKHDIELKAFHNEFTGVDFANADSVNDTIQVFYNSVVTGTPISLGRKITPRNINDGLCSRIAVFKMMPADFRMIARGNRNVNAEKNCELKQWAFKFDRLSGEMPIARLVDHVYKLCEEAAMQAEAENDLVLDYLRKRAVFYATWFTVPRIAARAISEAKDGENPVGLMIVEDSDLEFATLIYEAVIYWQDYFFGRTLQASWDNAAQEYKPRVKNSNNTLSFSLLPKQFSVKDVQAELNVSEGATRAQIFRWIKAGFVKKQKEGGYVKLVDQIM